jgi:hypothetical protein
VSSGHYTYGGKPFDEEAVKIQHLPLWIYVQLRHQHPDITREKAGKLLRDHPAPGVVQEVVLGLAGYVYLKKNQTTRARELAEAPTGAPSLPPSANSDSPTATLGDSPSPNSNTPSGCATGEGAANPPAD